MTCSRFQDADLRVLPSGIIVATPQRPQLAVGRAFMRKTGFALRAGGANQMGKLEETPKVLLYYSSHSFTN